MNCYGSNSRKIENKTEQKRINWLAWIMVIIVLVLLILSILV